MNNRFAIIMIVLVAAFAGIFIATKKQDEAKTDSGPTSQISNHVYGEGAKGVTLTEFGDYQCPYCSAYYPIVKQVTEKFKTDIKFEFVNFPIASAHPNAMAAHRAAEAADKQGKYWEMHDMLYEQHDNWENSKNVVSIFEGYAQQLGLNIDKFRADAASSAVNDTIQADIKKGTGLKVTGTPTFFLDGKKLDPAPQDPAAFEKLIQDAINAKKS